MTIKFISYPKSGRTWIRYIMKLIGCKLEFSHAGHDTGPEGIGEPFVDVRKDLLGGKTVFMYRNPLDTAVSMYFQIHKTSFRRSAGGFWRKFLKLAIRGRFPPKEIDKFVLHPVWGVENVCRFNRAWLDCLESLDDVLILSYEEAREDPVATIRCLMEFTQQLGHDPEQVAQMSSFESMKTLELSKGGSGELHLHGLKNSDQEGMKVRRGIVKGYRDYLTQKTIDEARKIASHYRFEI